MDITGVVYRMSTQVTTRCLAPNPSTNAENEIHDIQNFFYFNNNVSF
jgi:hypothetical protein